MKDPIRLLAGGGSNLERQLLEAADVDPMPAASLQRLSRALGMPEGTAAVPASRAPIGPAVAPSPSVHATTGAAHGTFGTLPLLVVGTAVLAALASQLRSSAPLPIAPLPSTVPLLTTVPAPTVTAASPAVTNEPARSPASSSPRASEAAPVPSTTQQEQPHPAASHPSAPRAGTPRPHAAAARTPPSAPSVPAVGLGAELRSLELIQDTLTRGRAEQAAVALGEHRQRFAHGELALEADLLDIDIDLARGQGERAADHARALLQKPEAAHYRQRLLDVGSEARPSRHD